jgi:hypothetical protein
MKSDPVENLLARLSGVKQVGDGQYMAKCPAHEDGHASLSVGRGDDGRALVKCQAGCTLADVVKAVGLSLPDLFTGNGDGRKPKAKPARIVATYLYRDAGGKLLFEVVRFDPKDFRQCRPDGKGGKVWNLDGTPRILYRWPELLAADPAVWVFICEGEKDCDTLARLGLVATTNPGGAGKWGKLADDSALHGRRVCIIPDRDGPGRKHAEDVARRLHGKAAEVRIIDLAAVEGFTGKDVTDWTEWLDGRTPAELAAALSGMAEAAPVWTPGEASDCDNGQAPTIILPSYLSAAQLCEKYPMLRPPVIDRLLRRGEVANVVAPPKMNKSWLVLYIALCVATGRPALGFETRPGRVLLLDYELSPATLAKRLTAIASAMNVDLADLGDRLAVESLRGKRLDIKALGLYVAALPPGRFDCIIIDPLYRTFPKELDENSNAHLADVYATFQGYAEQLDVGLIVVHHLTKGDQSGKGVTDLGAGGGSQSRAADAHLAIRPHAIDGAAVLSGVVRSFPPFDPVAMRWEYPLWTLAPDLDPADLKRPERRPKREAPEAKPPKPTWTVDSFVEQFVSANPQSLATITLAAEGQGMRPSKARQLLTAAVEAGRVHKWPGDGRGPDRNATGPKPLIE